jgi:hypothetical protein
MLTVAGVLAAAAVATPPALAIQHDGVRCVLADSYPRLTACVRPETEVALPHVYFRGADTNWYSIEMEREGECFSGVLPKPLRALRRIEYYIAVQSAAPPFSQGQTRVYSPEVRPPAKGCETPFATEAKVHAVPAEGGMRVPAGFSADGLVGLPKPERRAGGAALIIGAGAAVATGVGAATVIAASGGDDPTPTPSAPPATASPTPPDAPAPSSRPTSTPTPADGGPGPTPVPTLPVPTTTLLPPTTLLPLPTTLPLPRITLPPITLLGGLGEAPASGAAQAERALALRSVLDVPDGRAQVVLNGETAWMFKAGASVLRGVARRGTNRLELYLVEAAAPGTWQLEMDTRGGRPGSWRVVAGEAISISDHTLVVRARGRDDRIVVVFESD